MNTYAQTCHTFVQAYYTQTPERLAYVRAWVQLAVCNAVRSLLVPHVVFLHEVACLGVVCGSLACFFVGWGVPRH
jgi:hypothetical protein